MRRINVALLAASIMSLSASQNARADGEPRYSAPVAPVALAVSDWTGFYAGAHLGGAWSTTGATDQLGYNAIGDHWDAKPSGFVAGTQAGYNRQFGPVVLGIEGDLGDLGLNGSGTSHFAPTHFDTSSTTESDFYLTARGRLGFVVNHWMIYGTGGYMGADTHTSIIDACFNAPCGPSTIDATKQSFRSGWTAGGGVEMVLSGPWTAKAEYLYYDLGSTTVSGKAGGGVGPNFSWDTETRGNIVRAGLNYRFTGIGYGY
jgi:outer membrane immunogenic protein